MRNRRAITETDVPDVFDNQKIQHLADIVKIDGPGLARFGEGVRVAARLYARDTAVPSNNEVRREIATLHRLAERHDYPNLAKAIETMTSAARHTLELRRSNGAYRNHILRIPDPAELSNPDKRENAAAGLRMLIEVGGSWVEGRKRSNGHRSRSWRPVFDAPTASRGEPRREAERMLVINLQLAMLDTEAKGTTHCSSCQTWPLRADGGRGASIGWRNGPCKRGRPRC